MSYRIAINGYGRIGQCILRALYECGYRDRLQPVAINELSDIDTVTYLTRYDTTHGRFPLPVEQSQGGLQIGSDRIQVFNEENPARLPWQELGVDLVLECTGTCPDRVHAQRHLDSGAGRLLISRPTAGSVDATVVYGFNENLLGAEQRVVSNASCTTNGIVPVLRLLHEQLGIEQGMITTIHSAMNDQPVIDSRHHSDLRLARSAMQSIVPIDTGLALGIDRLLPELSGRFQALHMRVPTSNVSLMDVTLNLATDIDACELNRLLQQASRGSLHGLLGYSDEPLASVDFNHDRHSATIDGTQTRVSGQRMVKLVAWFDNEWGYSNRMLDVAAHWLHAALNNPPVSS
ncbi:erythrose-4-phosphate dehydrogenase [Aestuariirhabdus sp. Z084]|uniref:type I glyceraldehyde-3-phosphate dehydrogenase n=1 Tax=Aestuariirhabdus haliotis TaxID=2918751 RepID=UPI00201B3E52|nr:glyceraldehyde 3-phosphate dehydrogenase NAD-binding domain-containing protein [Aestuariirhabdus haliotis]MCL6414122.1 erythrose-4-phosphate dehydrogenase [Aestuariirhabdus haliotis]MCL6418054.1 erythrose-4-phosphate dehydrogenase [Aestuariirhabdus haliotis]